MLIHGGFDGDTALSDSFIFDVEASKWHDVSKAFPFPARAGHQMFLSPDGECLFLAGGGDNEGTFFSDLFTVKVADVLTTVTELSL